MGEKVCKYCGEKIQTLRDHFVSVQTFKKGENVESVFFHIICWRRYFEDCTRKKALAVVNGMQDRMMPIAEQMSKKLKNIIENN